MKYYKNIITYSTEDFEINSCIKNFSTINLNNNHLILQNLAYIAVENDIFEKISDLCDDNIVTFKADPYSISTLTIEDLLIKAEIEINPQEEVNKALGSTVSSLQLQLSNNSKKLEETKVVNSALGKAITNVSLENSKMQNQIEPMGKTLTNMVLTTSQLENKIMPIGQAVSSVALANSKVSKQLSPIGQAVSTLTLENAELKQQVAMLAKTIVDMQLKK